MEIWFEDYRFRVRLYRAIAVILLLTTILFFLLGIAFRLQEMMPVAVTSAIITIIIGPFFLFTGNKYRRYNGHLIVLHIAPIKNYLIIDGILQSEGGMLQHDYYGELPDGTQIAAKLGSFGNVNFAIGNFNNYNLTNF